MTLKKYKKEVLTPYEWKLRFADRVMEKMIETDMDISDLHHATGIYTGHLEKYLTASKTPKPDDISMIARAFGCLITELTGDCDVKIDLSSIKKTP